MLELSNLAWSFAHIAERNENLRNAIAAQAINHCQASSGMATSDGLNPNGMYSMVWSSWRTTKPRLAQSLVPHVGEPLVHGVLSMDGEWSREMAYETDLTRIFKPR